MPAAPDVVRDTLTTPERIAELFGPGRSHSWGRHEVGAIPFSSSEERQAENFSKMSGDGGGHPSILVKLADACTKCGSDHHCRRSADAICPGGTLTSTPPSRTAGMSKVKNGSRTVVSYIEPKAYERSVAG